MLVAGYQAAKEGVPRGVHRGAKLADEITVPTMFDWITAHLSSE